MNKITQAESKLWYTGKEKSPKWIEKQNADYCFSVYPSNYRPITRLPIM